MKLTRRALIGSSLALAACGERAQSQPAVQAAAPLPPLRAAPFPVGACVMAGQLSDPAFAGLLTSQFSQVTPRLHTIVSDWSPDEHGNPTRTIRARE